MRWVVAAATVSAVLGAAFAIVPLRGEGRPAGPALAAQERPPADLRDGALDLARGQLPRLRPVPPRVPFPAPPDGG